MPSFENIAPYYNFPNYISHTDIKKGWMNRLYHIVRNYTVKVKTNWIQSLFSKSKGNLLEIGAGTGAFANAMHKKGWKVTALEPDEGSRNLALSNYELKLSPISELYNLPFNEYDVITLWHVLEHVHDLKGYMGLFKSILKSNGRLIIAVPNNKSYDAQYYKQFWAAYDVPRHLYHFTPQSMNELCTNLGFEIVQYKPMWFDSYYVSLLSEKYKKSGKLGAIRAFVIGSISNFIAYLNHKKASSIIYEIKITH
jgi:2-polyprenyl-3-methyl-5-hydroxy-6-metoxy-1,4-benzoquinol methylase